MSMEEVLSLVFVHIAKWVSIRLDFDSISWMVCFTIGRPLFMVGDLRNSVRSCGFRQWGAI